MLLSIITVNFNNAKGLGNTIESVRSQSFSDYEWIIIDGGSTDESVERMEAHRHLFAYSVSEPDNGIYNGMNKGLAHAHGEYVLFLNSGDTLAKPDVLENIIPFLKEDVVVGTVMSQNGLAGGRHKAFSMADLYNYSLPHQAAFIKRNLFSRFGLYDERWHIVADWAFFIDAICFGQASFAFMPIVVCQLQEGGVSTNSEKRCAEAEALRKDKFGPYWQTDMQNALSLKEVLSHPLTRRLYGLVYRLRTFLK